MIFLTNRSLVEGITGYTFPDDCEIRPLSLLKKESSAPGTYTLIGRDDNALNALTDLLKRSSAQKILFYIHGFNNKPEKALDHAENLQAGFDAGAPGAVLVIPIIWPCAPTEKFIREKYLEDRKTAEKCPDSLLPLIQWLIDWRSPANANYKKIDLLARSMGNFVLRETLNRWDKNNGDNPVPTLFWNLFLSAADIENSSLDKDKQARCPLSDSVRNVVVYYAWDDHAIRNDYLGHGGPANMENVGKNVYTVNCDTINGLLDPLVGHSYMQPKDGKGNDNPAFQHMAYAVVNNTIKPEQKEYSLPSPSWAPKPIDF